MDRTAADLFNERYKRQLQLPGFGPEAQQKLSAANVLVIGAGGLGVPVLQYLTGMGIGTITIIDGDAIALSNLHRQVLYSGEEAGLSKAETAAHKLRALNPNININCLKQYFTPDNALGLIREAHIVVDATDNFSARYLINDACIILNKPFVYGAVYQYEGYVSVFNFEDGPTYRCLYPVAPVAHEFPDCNTSGVLGVVPGIVGCAQALQVVKMITGIGKTLSGYLQIFDFLNDEQYKIKLTSKEENKLISKLQDTCEAVSFKANAKKITAPTLQKWYAVQKPFLLIDVRAEEEYRAGHLPNAVNHPLQSLYSSFPTFKDEVPVIVYCNKGSMSAKAAAFLQEHHHALNLYELEDGLDSWIKHQRR